jgi:hypothetical protein
VPSLPRPPAAPAGWQQLFLRILPALRAGVEFAFRALPAECRAEAVQESLANACVACARLAERGLAGRVYATALARYAAAQVRAGRRVGTSVSARDVLTSPARQAGRYTVLSLDHGSDRESWHEAVITDHKTPVPDQVAFKLDFGAWLAALSPRQRRIALALAEGVGTGAAARRFRVSAGRVSQLRRELHESWLRFQKELEPSQLAGPTGRYDRVEG